MIHEHGCLDCDGTWTCSDAACPGEWFLRCDRCVGRAHALVPQQYCEVCEEPSPALLLGRYHEVQICFDCLLGELDIFSDEAELVA